MSTSELACTYACLILHDEDIPITAEKISTLVGAANVKVESYWPGLFAKLLQKRSVEELILNVGTGSGAAFAGAGIVPAVIGVAGPGEADEENKDDLKEESDEELGFDIFGGDD